jgi:ribosomal subunit interface protein
MELAVHGKQMDVGEALRAHVQDRLADLNQKYFNHTAYASVTFSRDGHGKKDTKAHITLQLGKNILVTADGIEKDPYIAFDAAATKAGKQLRRYKTRLRDHHDRIERSPEEEFLKAQDYILAGSPEQDNEVQEDHIVIAEMTTNIQTMSVSEATMRLDLSGQPALMFRNASHGGLNMVYQRSDGNIGWVDPEHQKKK